MVVVQGTPVSDKIILKFPLADRDIQQIVMPKGVQILAVQNQSGVMCIWGAAELTLVDQMILGTSVAYEARTFMIVGTGRPMTDYEKLTYIGTAQNGQFVWHIFELNRKGE